MWHYIVFWVRGSVLWLHVDCLHCCWVASMVSWPDQCYVRLSVILASVLTSATHTTHTHTHTRTHTHTHTHTHTDTHTHTAVVHSRGVVSVAIESPGQQVNKGDAAGGMWGKEGGWVVLGRVRGDSWRGLMGDERVGGSGWPWPPCGGQMGCGGHRPWARRMKSGEG